jgi:cyclopropane fatty-acyl-phospholipid synthase-like methyltransferase
MRGSSLAVSAALELNICLDSREFRMLPVSEACERNKEPILAVLRECLADRVHVLEIGSGTGQHAVHFARHLTHLTWHPTEQLNYLPDLAARIQLEGASNVRPPTVLDVRQSVWPLRSVDAVFTANTMHIMSWVSVNAMFHGIGAVLAPGGVMCVYGPFRYDGRYTSDSNRDFDQSLKERDPASGLRDIRDVTEAAEAYGLRLEADHDLPAFNRLLVFVKEPA